jgi:hypothetical protein
MAGHVATTSKDRSHSSNSGTSLSMKSGRQSTKGYSQGSDLSVDRCASYELDGDARHDKVFIQVQPP